MRLNLILLIPISVIVLCVASDKVYAQVPSIDPDYSGDVETWWASHPFNPENPNHIPIGSISAPIGADKVTLSPGADIQAAIMSAPPQGRVIYLEPGIYTHNIDLVGKSHIHLIGNSDPKSTNPVIIKGGIDYDHALTGPSIKVPSNISSCDLIKNYDDFNSGVNTYAKGNISNKAYMDCFLNPVKDIYFKNIVFDGNNTAEMAFMIRGVRDMVWDILVFQNFDNPGQYQIGLIHGNSGLENIWCRSCIFAGSQRYAYLLDGVTGGGVISSVIKSRFSGGGVGFFTNDDFTIDLNRNGVVEENEQRVSKYIVVYGTTFDVGANPISMHAKKSLIKNNTATSGFMSFFVSFSARRSSRYYDASKSPYLIYEYFGNRVVGNKANTVDNFVVVNVYTLPDRECDPAIDGCGRIGKYQVRSNSVGQVKQNFVWENNTSLLRVEGPNSVCGNLVGGSVYRSACGVPSNTEIYLPIIQSSKGTSVPPVGQMPSTREYFPVGVFSTVGRFGSVSQFESLLNDLQSRNFDSIIAVNGPAYRADEYLTVADRFLFNIYWQNGIELNEQWWPHTVPATIQNAREVIYPLIDVMKSLIHPSLKGYYTDDEPFLDRKDKVWLANQAYREKDPDRPAFAVLAGVKRVTGIFDPQNDKVLVIDLYTLRAPNKPCEFRRPEIDPETGTEYDFPKFIRDATVTKPAETPLWMILQAHSFDSPNDDGNDLRIPSVEELRAQQWMAVGEGTSGIFWFMLGSNSTVAGFEDNAVVYNEISDLARRVKGLRSTLVNFYKAPDQFQMTGMPAGTLPYASSLKSFDGMGNLVVAVNRSCSSQQLALSSNTIHGKLRDLETGQVYAYGTPIPFRGGDGRVFEVIP